MNLINQESEVKSVFLSDKQFKLYVMTCLRVFDKNPSFSTSLSQMSFIADIYNRLFVKKENIDAEDKMKMKKVFEEVIIKAIQNDVTIPVFSEEQLNEGYFRYIEPSEVLKRNIQ